MQSEEKQKIYDISIIKRKALKYWKNPEFIETSLKGNLIFFPPKIPIKKISGTALLNDFAAIRKGISDLEECSKKYSFTIEYVEVNNRKIGRQKISKSIVFEDIITYLKFISKEKDFKALASLIKITEGKFPELTDYIYKYPFKALKKKNEWSRILSIISYFRENPFPNIYVRQIAIKDINTKFIEKNKSIISKILCFLYPEKYGKYPVSGSANSNTFEVQFGLLYDQPQIRFRILDKDYYFKNNSDVSLAVEEFNNLDLPVEKVFITENKICALVFPDCKKSIVIFGKGYSINSLQDAEWLKNEKIYYWGDIDTHGFHILSNLRSFLPQTKSFFMDKKTLISNKKMRGRESDSKRYTGDLENLTKEENELFKLLKSNYYGENVRFEQEFVPYDDLLHFVKNIDEI